MRGLTNCTRERHAVLAAAGLVVLTDFVVGALSSSNCGSYHQKFKAETAFGLFNPWKLFRLTPILLSLHR